MALKDFLMGTPARIEAMPTMSKEQQSLFSNLLSQLGPIQGQGMEYLSKILGGDTEAFEKPLMRQFEEQTIPSLAERFSGMDAMGSSAFKQSLGQAGAGLSENLGALRGQLQQGALGQLAQLLGMGTQTPTFQYQQIPGTEGALRPLLSGIGSGIGSGLGFGGMGMLGKKLGLLGG